MTESTLPLRARPLGPMYRWSLRVVAFAGFALSAYLTWAGAEGLPGCDAADPGGCGAVLSTVWGTWLGLPVSLGGAAVFLALLLSTVAMGPRPSSTRWFLKVASAATAFAASVWFTGLMALEVRAFCPWCTAVHVCSLLALALVAARVPFFVTSPGGIGQNTQSPASPFVIVAGLGLAAVLFSFLLAGQLIGGYEIRIDVVKIGELGAPLTEGEIGAAPNRMEASPEVVAVEPGPTGAPAVEAADAALPAPVSGSGSSSSVSPRPITLMDGKLSMMLGEYPILGDPDAEHVLGVISDPTCPACRKIHGDLLAAIEHFDRRFAVVLFPMALDAKCNPALTRTGYGHRNACLFDTMSLALWNTDPAAFRRFDEALYRGMTPPEADQALGWAEELIGKERFNEAMNDPLYEKMLNFSISLFYSPLVDEKLLPVLLGPKEAKLGNPDSVDELHAWIAGQFGWDEKDAARSTVPTAANDAPASNSLE